VRFRTEYGDAVAEGIALQKFLDAAHSGHAVADHDQPLPFVHHHVHGNLKFVRR